MKSPCLHSAKSKGHGRERSWRRRGESRHHGYGRIFEEDKGSGSVHGVDRKYGNSNSHSHRRFQFDSHRAWGFSWKRREPEASSDDRRRVGDSVTRHGGGGRSNKDDVGCGDKKRLGSADWRPPRYPRSRSFCERRSEHWSKRVEEGKDELQHDSGSESQGTSSKKKCRLNWGEGLAKFEREKLEKSKLSANKGFPDSATPSSGAGKSSLQGVDDNLFLKAANVDSDVNNSRGSAGHGSQNLLHQIDIDLLTGLRSSHVELLKTSDKLSSLDINLARSTTLNKLQILKADVLKVLEETETKVDLLENELNSLKSRDDRFQCSPAVGSLPVYDNAKSCDKHAGGFDKIAHLEPLENVSFNDSDVRKMPLSINPHGMRDDMKDDTDSPRTAVSKSAEQLAFGRADSSCDARRYGTCSEGLDGIQSTDMKCLVPCTYRQVSSISTHCVGNSSMEIEDGKDVDYSTSFYSSTEDALYKTIISSNKESAKRAWEVFANLLPTACGKISNIGVGSSALSHTGASVLEKFAEKQRFAKFKEKVLAIKFKAFRYLWKEDMRVLSTVNCHPKSRKEHEWGLRTIHDGHEKKRYSIRSHFRFPAGSQVSLVRTSDMINYTSQLLAEPQDKVSRSTLKMPALILDQQDKIISMFKSSNGLVEDPLAIEKERVMINPWTSEEREIFLEKFAAFGKDFRKIASFLDHKTTADCVEFYYKNHKSDFFEKIKKKRGKRRKMSTVKTPLIASGKKRNRRANVASLEIPSTASVMAHGIAGNRRMRSRRSLIKRNNMETSTGDDSVAEKQCNLDLLQDESEPIALADQKRERETGAADVLTGICGSLSSEAMISSITCLVDPVEVNRDRNCMKARPSCQQSVTPDVARNTETCSDESCVEMDPSVWTDMEKEACLQAVSSFGKDFAMIAECVGTKSQYECKNFISKTQRCLRSDQEQPRCEYIGLLENDVVNGSRNDTDDAHLETISGIDTEKSGSKTDEDMPSAVMNPFHDESNPVDARNLPADLNESKEINGEVGLEDVNMVSNTCVIKGESKLGSEGSGVVLHSFDKSGSVRNQRAIIMSDCPEVGTDKPNELGDAVRELVSWGDHLHVSNINHRDGEHEADMDAGIELKDKDHDSSTAENIALSSMETCSRLTFGAENQHKLSVEKARFSGLSVDDPFVRENRMLQNTVGAAVQQKETATNNRLSSTHDFQQTKDMSGHGSICYGGYVFRNPGNLFGHVEAAGILQFHPSQETVKKEVNMNMSCSSSVTGFPFLSQKVEQTDYKTQLQCSSDSEETSRIAEVRLFGKILTHPLSPQKPNLTAKGKKENDTHPEVKNNKHNPKGASASTRNVNDHYGVAISSLQQQGRRIVGMYGVSDPLKAIKKHYSNDNESGSFMGEDES